MDLDSSRTHFIAYTARPSPLASYLGHHHHQKVLLSNVVLDHGGIICQNLAREDELLVLGGEALGGLDELLERRHLAAGGRGEMGEGVGWG
jgi:hypothetical protein